MVNEAGRRFMNEALNYYDAGEAFGRRSGPGPRNFPAWLVFDQEGVDRYGVLAYKVPPEDERPEWFHAADTIRDLARSINVEPDAMQLTIERFNGFARSGLDTDFGRGESEWDRAWGDPNNTPNPSLGTIDRSPFYAVPIYPGAVSTRGGLRVDDIGRVLSAKSGEPIPGLYGAGNCSNGSAAGGYAGPGATIGPAMTFGYLIGRTVADAVGRG
jgi:3-oxosteroid 1-dehydrogenase